MSSIPAPLVDASARNRVTTSLSANLFVEAGAGSGKTTSLVRRVVKLVSSGIPVTHIAAITFTDSDSRRFLCIAGAPNLRTLCNTCSACMVRSTPLVW